MMDLDHYFDLDMPPFGYQENRNAHNKNQSYVLFVLFVFSVLKYIIIAN